MPASGLNSTRLPIWMSLRPMCARQWRGPRGKDGQRAGLHDEGGAEGQGAHERLPGRQGIAAALEFEGTGKRICLLEAGGLEALGAAARGAAGSDLR